MPTPLDALLTDIRACDLCHAHLPLGPRPVVQASRTARLLIVGQAPGTRVHASGVPWDDASGRRLREWLGLAPDVFSDARHVAIVPMGFCYPGRAHGGDAPPRSECRERWHPQLMPMLRAIELTLAIGQYAQAYLLGDHRRATLTDTVQAWRDYGDIVPLPHPSPRNVGWFKRNPWFEAELVPAVRARVAAVLAG